MAFKFPFSTLHELNLDWILEQVKKFSELIPPMETAVEDVNALTDDVQQAMEDAQTAVEQANEAAETAANALEVAEQAASGTIADGAVTTPKLAAGAVTTAKIDDGAVTGAKIAAGTIQAANLDAGCVTTTQILDGTISPNDLGSECVTNSKIGAAAVTTNKINDGAVTTSKLDAGAVTTAKIADNAINYSKLAPELRQLLLHGYFPSVGRADGDVAISIPYDGNATTAVLSVTTVNVDVYGTGGSGAFTLTLNQISVADGSIYLKFTPSSSVSTVAPNASVCLIAVKGIQYVQLS